MTKNAYAQSGVDVEAGYEVVERIKKHVARTERAGVMGALGGFGGMFDLSKTGVKEPVLISGTDGVGTKLMLAIKYDKHDTIGQDCVAMCVNDIIAAGAEPLYFLDYVATGKNEPAKLEQVVAGVAEGCVQAGAALIGGETAEMPGMYGVDDYDLAGFAVGVAEKSQIIDGSKVAEGDVLLGLASSGIHSNGYSLVRRVFANYTGEEILPELEGKKLKEVLLEPTRIYVKAVLPLIKEGLVNGIAHITGGGFIENVPRMFADDLAAEIEEDKVPVLPIFKALEKYGQIKHEEMFEIFNMGVGLMLAIKYDKHDTIGQDCVAMCVNDIIAAGAEPLYFLDYVATGKNEPAKLEQVVAGVAEGCVQAGAALIGGETAEMPGMYGKDDYDLAGFAVGVAEKSQIIDGSKVSEGDVLLGLASSGIHSNGFSLVRRVFADYTGEEILPELEGKKLKEVLLEPTRIYVKAVLPLIKEGLVNGIAHITGGGFIENVPRMFAADLAAEIEESKVPVLPIFKALEKYGQIKHEEMFEIFNMGVGLMLAVSPENVIRVKELLDEPVYEIGRIVKKENESVIIK